MKAVFCGNGTLLIQCAETFREAGGEITGILTADQRIRDWAQTGGLPLWGTPDAPDLPQETGFEYLFSVANLSVLPGDLIARASRAAINFHDGPLPQMAGLNTPAWALIEGHDRHAITWHEMVEKVDAGGILSRSEFDILPTDTAFSLNAKCYEAGLQAFRDLIPALMAGTAKATPMSGDRHWYGRAKRPETLGFLDFTRSAATLDQMVRGLNFGGYDNPLGTAKIATKAGPVIVTALEIDTAPASAPAGRVLGGDATRLTVAAGDHAVTLSGLTKLDGTAFDASALGAGTDLPTVPAMEAQPLRAIGQAEPLWTEALAQAAPALPPYPARHGTETGTLSAPLIAGGLSAEQIAAGFLAWSAGLRGAGAATLGLRLSEPDHPGLSTLCPLTLTLDPKANGAALAAHLGEMRDAARAPAAPWPAI